MNPFKTTKHPYQPLDCKNPKKILESKISRLLPNVYDFQKGNDTLRFGFKNLQKIYGFLFFVISIS
jgi:hypothetical protein